MAAKSSMSLLVKIGLPAVLIAAVAGAFFAGVGFAVAFFGIAWLYGRITADKRDA